MDIVFKFWTSKLFYQAGFWLYLLILGEEGKVWYWSCLCDTPLFLGNFSDELTLVKASGFKLSFWNFWKLVPSFWWVTNVSPDKKLGRYNGGRWRGESKPNSNYYFVLRWRKLRHRMPRGLRGIFVAPRTIYDYEDTIVLPNDGSKWCGMRANALLNFGKEH